METGRKAQVEHAIRDELVQNLDLIEKGLTLVEKEKYLPSTVGTRGFVDILAKDSRGKFVIIELKRSNSASRDALHEVLKYVEGIKENLSVREDELRVIVISTEWTELLVPFSSFVARVNFSIAGLKLNIDSDLKPKSVEAISTLPVRNDRVFAPWHELNMQTSAQSAADCIRSYEHACAEKGINDYVLVEMNAHPERREMEIQSIMAVSTQFGPGMSRDEIESKVTCFNHAVYFSPLMLSDEYCMNAVKRLGDSEDIEEFLEYIEIYKAEDLTCKLHEKLYEVGPDINRGHFEISYPAKFGVTMLDNEKWSIHRIHRYGTLAANTLLTDDVIVGELRGETGTTGQRYKREVDLSNSGEIASLKAEIQARFDHNEQLAHQLLYCIDEALRSNEGCTLTVKVFCPSYITLSIFKAATDEEWQTYTPNSTIFLLGSDGTPITAFCITLEPTGRKPSFSRFIDKFFDGNPGGPLFNLQWGGFDSRDLEICDDIGISYEASKLDIHSNQAFRLVNFKWKKIDSVTLFGGLSEFIEANEAFVADIVNLYGGNWNGFMVTHDASNGYGEFTT